MTNTVKNNTAVVQMKSCPCINCSSADMQMNNVNINLLITPKVSSFAKLITKQGLYYNDIPW